MSLNLRSLIAKLNETTRVLVEDAAGLCVSRTHYDIEIEHYFVRSLQSSENDVAAILKHYGADRLRLTADLERALDNLKTGNTRSPSISPTLVKMLSNAWTIGSIEYDAGSIRTGFTLLALLINQELSPLAYQLSGELRRIEPEGLRKEFYAIVGASTEVQEMLTAGGARRDGTTAKEAMDGKAKASLSDEELARLAKALIRELMPKESLRGTPLTRNEMGPVNDPGS